MDKKVRIKLKPVVEVTPRVYRCNVNGNAFELSSERETEVPNWLLASLRGVPFEEVASAEQPADKKASK